MELTFPICTPYTVAMVERKLADHIKKLFKQFPVLTVTGPRQSGKTTLVKSCFSHLPYLNLEHLETRDFAREDPVAFLKTIPDGAILDEIQNVPELSSYIQVRVDSAGKEGQFVLTGSQQFNMLQTVSQSLAGRTAIVRLLPFAIEELDQSSEYGRLTMDEYIFNGFYPRIYDKGIDPAISLSNYMDTYIEKDLRQLSQVQDLMLFRKFVKLCAGRVGQILNLSHLADDVGINHKTAGQWISLLETSFIVYRLPPYFANINKRLIKSPKLYFYDTGLAAHLMGIEEKGQIEAHPLRGALFENLVIAEFVKYRYNRGKRENLSFFRDAKGHEVDLIYTSGSELMPVEIKAAQTFRSSFFKGLDYFNEYIASCSRSMVIYGGERTETRSEGIVTHIHEAFDAL